METSVADGGGREGSWAQLHMDSPRIKLAKMKKAFLMLLSIQSAMNRLKEAICFAFVTLRGDVPDRQHASPVIIRLDPDVIENLIHDTVRIKASIVEADELEAGERRFGCAEIIQPPRLTERM